MTFKRISCYDVLLSVRSLALDDIMVMSMYGNSTERMVWDYYNGFIDP